MIYSWLSRFTAREASGNKANQHKASVSLADHKRSSAVPLARVLAPVPVAGTHHLGVQLHSDPRPLVPHLALVVLDQWNVHHLQHLGPLLLLGNQECQRSKLIIWDDCSPTSSVGNRSRLQNIKWKCFIQLKLFWTHSKRNINYRKMSNFEGIKPNCYFYNNWLNLNTSNITNYLWISANLRKTYWCNMRHIAYRRT